MSYVKVKGIVIKETNTGEADKIVTIFAKGKGKIQAFAKGARRSKSKMVAGTQFLSYCDYVLFSGKDMYSLNSSEVIEPFYKIRNDLEKLTYAAHFVDILNDIIQENQPQSKVLQLFLNSLHFLCNTEKQPELIGRIFELRLLSIIGFTPFVRGCLICGNDEDSNYSFSFQKCGFICSNESCITTDKFAVDLSIGAAKAIHYIVHSSIDELFSFNLSPEVLEELGYITRRYLRERLEREYNKLDFLKNIN